MLLLLLLLQLASPDLLVTSTMLGQEAEVRAMLDAGMPVDSKNREGDTALLTAAGYRQPGLVRLLLDRGADPNLTGRTGRTALAEAAWDGEVGIMRMLLEAGADPSAGPDDMVPLYTAVLSGNPEAVRLLLDHGADPDPRTEETPLLRAATTKFPEAVRMLLAAGADPTRPGRDGRPPVQEAAGRGDLQSTLLLLEAGVDPETLDGAFDLAAAGRHAEVVALLLPRVRDLDRALLSACAWGHVEAAADLLRRGADPAKRRPAGPSALEAAAGGWPSLALDVLWEERWAWEAPPAAPDRSADLVALVLRHGADPVVDGPAALLAAARTGHAETAVLLLDVGVPLDSRDPQGATPLTLAAWAGDPALVAELLRRGADPAALDAEGRDALELMTRKLESMQASLARMGRSRALVPGEPRLRALVERYAAARRAVADLLGRAVP